MKNLRHAIWKSNLFCFFLATTAFGSDFLEDLGPSGSVRSSVWSRDRSQKGKNPVGTGAIWLNMRSTELAGFKLFADGYLQEKAPTRYQDSKGDVRELYLQKSVGDFDFKFGRMITAWGRADKFNPTDQITVKNLKLLAPEDDDQKTGTGSFQSTFNLGSFRMIGIWLPEWRSPIYPIKEDPSIVIQDKAPDRPQDQFAFKIDESGGSFDWSLSFFRGYNRIPDLRFSNFDGKIVVIDAVYDKINSYGADFASSLGDVSIRGEVCYIETTAKNIHEAQHQNSNASLVLGADRNFFENFNLNIQALYKHVYGFVSDDDISQEYIILAAQNHLNSNQTASDNFGATMRPSYKLLNDTLEIEFAYVKWWKKPSSLFRPKVTYAFTDHAKGVIGAELYSGEDDSYFGRLKEISSVFSEVRYGF